MLGIEMHQGIAMGVQQIRHSVPALHDSHPDGTVLAVRT